jgi:hypothetical protein
MSQPRDGAASDRRFDDQIACRPRLRMKLKTKLERAHHHDRYFTIASIALMVLMVVAGLGAWMFGNSRAAAVDQPARHSTVR